MPYNGLTATYKAFLIMDTNELKQKIEGLLNECPERKEGAARAATSDEFKWYICEDYLHVIQDYCCTHLDFYELVAEGNSEKIAAYIESEIDSLRNSFIEKIEKVNERY
jgi:hypothetical protein